MRFDPVVEDFLTAAGCRVTEPDAHAAGWERGDIEHIVRRGPAGYTFSRRERRQQLSRDETATSWDLAQRVVLVKEGRSWRSHRDLPDLPRDLDVRGTGLTVTAHPPFATLEVTRPDGTTDTVTGLVLAQALRLARTVDQPFDRVVTSLRAVDGGRCSPREALLAPRRPVGRAVGERSVDQEPDPGGAHRAWSVEGDLHPMRLEPAPEAFVVDSGYRVTEPDRDSLTWNRGDLQQIVRRPPEGYGFSS